MENVFIYGFLTFTSFLDILIPFSGSATITPILALLTDPHTAIGLASFFFAISGIVRVFIFRKHIVWSEIKQLLPLSVLFAVIGASTLIVFNETVLLSLILIAVSYFFYKKIRIVINKKRKEMVTKKYTGTNIVLKKRVSFVRAKGGEFALKVSVFVNAKKYIERVNIIDRLPPLVKIYDRFGGERPTRIDEKTRRVEWNFEKLEEGEIRLLSYIIYSKVGIMGKFALPTATAIFEREGTIHEKESNRAFFINEPHPTKKNKDEGI